MQEPLAVRFTYRIIGTDGTVKVSNLEHKHESKWTLQFVMPGAVGSAVVGRFEIPLHDPGSNEAQLVQDDYDIIKEQMRIEGYLGDEIAGDPLVTGIIRERPTSMNNFTIKGADITILAHQALTGRNEKFSGTTDQLFLQSLRQFKLLFRDKFLSLSQWSTNPGGWALGSANLIGLPTVTLGASAGGDALMLSNTSFTKSDYKNAYVDVLYQLQCGTSTGNYAEGGVIMSASDANNLILGRGMMRRISVNSKVSYQIDAEIWTKTAGVYSTKPVAKVSNVIHTPNATELVKVTMTSDVSGPTTYRDLVMSMNPTLYYRFNETSGTTLIDTTANRLNSTQLLSYSGTIATGMNASPGAITSDNASNIAHNLDGEKPWEAVSPLLGNDDLSVWSVSWWMKKNNQGSGVWGASGPWDFGQTGGGPNGWLMVFNNSTGKLAVQRQIGSLTSYTSGGLADDGAWHHFVLVHTAGTGSLTGDSHFSLYVDGVATDTNVTWGYDRSYQIPTAFHVASTDAGAGGNPHIQIDELAVFMGQALSTTQITDLKNAAPDPLNTSQYKQTYSVILNGFHSGCTYTTTTPPSGKIGLRSLNSTGSQTWASNLAFPSRQAVFNVGTVTAGMRSLDQTYSNTPMLDRWNTAAVTEGVGWRVVRHPFIDAVDFGPQVGTDLSNSVHFIEGKNLSVESSIEPNTDPPLTATRLLASPGQVNSGFVEWINLDAADTYGLVYDNMQAQNISDTVGQLMLAKQFSSLRGSPGVAKKLKVQRDIETADKFTIGDFIKVTSPRLNLFEQVVQVMALSYEEGKAEIDIVGDQYPKDWTVTDERRMRQQLDNLATGTASLGPSSSSGLVYDNRYGSPFILPAYSGYQAVDTTHNMRLRFDIPQNMGVLQRTLLSFSLQPFRSGIQSTAASNTSGASSTSTSSSQTHFHSISLGNYHVDEQNVTWSPSQNSLETTYAGGGFVNTNIDGAHTHDISHTHSIPALSISNPSGLYEVGMAQGAHVIIDGVDQTSALGGPWGSGSTLDVSELDITAYIDSPGWHEVAISSTAIGGIIAGVYVFGLLKSF